MRLAERTLPASFSLAVTSALEHYTATLTETLLGSEDARAMFDTGEARDLLLWHVLEEYEHKAVAFDVFQTVSGSHRIRVGVMNAVTAAFIGGAAFATALSMLTDRSARNQPIHRRDRATATRPSEQSHGGDRLQRLRGAM